MIELSIAARKRRKDASLVELQHRSVQRHRERTSGHHHCRYLSLILHKKTNTKKPINILFYLSTFKAHYPRVSSKRFTFTLTLLAMLPG
jgi:hypothetical protein